ncbi:group III secreted phospholipase A2-3A2-like [Scleropages formosus]|uniref:phospholipase A2 n=1 Tax=Scleropages formosus TaxID=113540 RepID=A0A0P7UX88_SCLFO|nr:group III secreted phospholipase A2-3A2-like [Scleropages formosus]
MPAARLHRSSRGVCHSSADSSAAHLRCKLARGCRALCLALLALGCWPAARAHERSPDAAAAFCHWTSGSAPAAPVAHTFLRRSAGALRLFHSTWTENGSLGDCAVIDRPDVAERYWSECRGERAARFSDAPDRRVNVSRLLALESTCVNAPGGGDGPTQREKRDLGADDQSRSTDDRAEDRPGSGSEFGSRLRRQKRAWIFPGTLWCGMGNKASSFEDLGLFEQTDGCCREHDYCKETISSFETNYGLLNRNFFTVSHCDCDRRFRQCLLGVNDTISNTVGYTYFNILKIPCFFLKPTMQCTQMSWWGKCNVSQVSPLAILRDAIVYNSTHPSEEVDEVSDVLISVAENKSDIVDPILDTEETSKLPTTVPRNESTSWELPRPTADGSESITTPTISSSRHPEYSSTPKTFSAVKVVPTHLSTGLQDSTHHPMDRDPLESLENALPTIPPLPEETVPSNHLQPIQDPRHRSKKRPCACYKHLDECMYKIPPGEEQFGLQNLEPKTLYHCNCTKRWARQLMKTEEPDSFRWLLLDFVSLSCFKTPRHEDCSSRTGCSAVLRKAPHIQKALGRGGAAELGGLPETPSFKVKRRNAMAPKRRRAPVRLYRRCLRLVRSSQRDVNQLTAP